MAQPEIKRSNVNLSHELYTRPSVKTPCVPGPKSQVIIIEIGHGFIGYPKGRNVERALGFSLTWTVSTSPNLAKARVMIVALRAFSLAKFGEVDTVPVSE